MECLRGVECGLEMGDGKTTGNDWQVDFNTALFSDTLLA